MRAFFRLDAFSHSAIRTHDTSFFFDYFFSLSKFQSDSGRKPCHDARERGKLYCQSFTKRCYWRLFDLIGRVRSGVVGVSGRVVCCVVCCVVRPRRGLAERINKVRVVQAGRQGLAVRAFLAGT